MNVYSHVHVHAGDFHFLWECQRVLLEAFWGDVKIVGSLSNLRQYINRLSVDLKGKVFNTGDEFLVHCFHAHLTAAICQKFGIKSVDDEIPHNSTYEWLQHTAASIVSITFTPTQSCDTAYAFHRWLMRGCFLYVDLREAIRFEDGEQVIRLWKHWLVYFLGSKRKNYAMNLLCNLKCDFPSHIAYIVTNNRAVWEGGACQTT